MASDIGILMHTTTLAWLLDRKKMVPMRDLPWGELIKALATAVFACVAAFAVELRVPLRGSRHADLFLLLVITVTWAAAVALGLLVTRSKLINDLRRRKAAVTPPEPVVEP